MHVLGIVECALAGGDVQHLGWNERNRRLCRQSFGLLVLGGEASRCGGEVLGRHLFFSDPPRGFARRTTAVRYDREVLEVAHLLYHRVRAAVVGAGSAQGSPQRRCVGVVVRAQPFIEAPRVHGFPRCCRAGHA